MLGVFTQAGSCVSQSVAASLSAGFFMQQTLIPIGPSQNTAHWCPLPDRMSQYPYIKRYVRTDHTECTAGLNKLLYFMILTQNLIVFKLYMDNWSNPKPLFIKILDTFLSQIKIRLLQDVYRGQDWGQTHLGTKSPFSCTTWHQDPTGLWHFSSSQSFSETWKNNLVTTYFFSVS